MEILESHGLPSRAATTKWAKAPETITMQEEIQAMEAQRRSLQLLVSELLLANQKLRLEIAKLTQANELSAPATHPQPLLDH
jgi:hypothetical protein